MCLHNVHQDAKVRHIWFLVRGGEEDERWVGEGGEGGVQLEQPRGDAQVGRVRCLVVEQLVSPVGVVFKVLCDISRLRSAKFDLLREEDGEPFIVGQASKNADQPVRKAVHRRSLP